MNQPRLRPDLLRTRWAAIGAAVAVVAGAGGLAYAGAASSPSSLVTIAPCRVADSRLAGGAYAAGETRTLQIAGTGAAFAAQGGAANGCSIPAGVPAVEATITAVAPSSGGFTRVWPSDGAEPNATALNFGPGQSISNTGVLPLSTVTSALKLRSYGISNYVIDVVAYFAPGSSPTTTNATSPFGPSEVVSRPPASDAPLGYFGTLGGVSSTGRYVLFSSDTSCGPMLRDRTLGTTRALFTAASDGTCSVFPAAVLGTSGTLSSNGGRALFAASTSGQSCGPSAGGSVPKVIDIATGSILSPFVCTDTGYFGSFSYFSVPPGVSQASPTATVGSIGQPVLTGDGNSMVYVRTTFTSTWSFADPFAPSLTSVRVVDAIEKVTLSNSSKSTVSTLFDSTVGGGSVPNHPAFALVGTDSTGAVSILNTSASLLGTDTNSVPDGYAVSALGKVLLSSGTGGSSASSISPNGRFVAFSSYSTSIVANDTNGKADAFVLDRTTGVTERVSISSSGAQSNRDVVSGSVSDNGRYVSFSTDASTLGCPGQFSTFFVRDRTAGRTYAPLHTSEGRPAPVSSVVSSAAYFSFVTGVFSQPYIISSVSSDGSTFVGNSPGWAGDASADPGTDLATRGVSSGVTPFGAAPQRVWARSTALPSQDC